MVETLHYASENFLSSPAAHSGKFGLKYVITGGPGVGKTTVINELERLGYAIVPEVARQIISVQLPHGILPWTDLSHFQLLVLDRQRDLESRTCDDVIFCDRGVVDGMGYCREGNISIPAPLANAAQTHRYAGVFLLDPLPNYSADRERVEDAERARTIHDLIADSYRQVGYDVIRVRVLPPTERAQFILEKIGGKPYDRNTNTQRSTCTTHA